MWFSTDGGALAARTCSKPSGCYRLKFKAPFESRTELVLQTMHSLNCIHWSGNALGWKRPASAMQFAAPGTSWMLQPVFSAEWLGVIIGVTGVTRLELLQGKGWQRQLYKETEVAEVLDRLIFHHFLFRDGIWLGHIATLPLKCQHSVPHWHTLAASTSCQGLLQGACCW